MTMVGPKTVANWFGWSYLKAWRWMDHLNKQGASTPRGTPIVRRGGKGNRKLFTTRKLLVEAGRLGLEKDLATDIDPRVEVRLRWMEGEMAASKAARVAHDRQLLEMSRRVQHMLDRVVKLELELTRLRKDVLEEVQEGDVEPVRIAPQRFKVPKAEREKLAPWRGRSVVYFVAADQIGLVKIGWSKEVVRRFEALAQGSPTPLRVALVTSGGRRSEQAMHRRFAEYRSYGEWFRVEGALKEFLANTKALAS